jgi:hypothetical protein
MMVKMFVLFWVVMPREIVVLKMKTVHFFKMLVSSYECTQCHSPEHHNQHLHHLKNPTFQVRRNSTLLGHNKI